MRGHSNTEQRATRNCLASRDPEKDNSSAWVCFRNDSACQCRRGLGLISLPRAPPKLDLDGRDPAKDQQQVIATVTHGLPRRKPLPPCALAALVPPALPALPALPAS